MKTQTKQEEVIYEFGASIVTGAQIYTALRMFYLKVIEDGPPIEVKTGQRLGLSHATAADLFFAGRIRPDLPEVARWEVINAFTIVEEGRYKHLKPGMVLELTADEALPLLRNKKIKIQEVQADES